jgi:hypothetical protein
MVKVQTGLPVRAIQLLFRWRLLVKVVVVGQMETLALILYQVVRTEAAVSRITKV